MQGLENTSIFCGDGINDLAALSAADVGMAIGATDANVAAAITTAKPSIAGMCHHPTSIQPVIYFKTNRTQLNSAPVHLGGIELSKNKVPSSMGEDSIKSSTLAWKARHVFASITHACCISHFLSCGFLASGSDCPSWIQTLPTSHCCHV